MVMFFIFVLYQKKKIMKTITAKEVNTKAGTKQAKEWGYKSIKAAEKDGYNVRPCSMTFKEIAEIANISEREAKFLCIDWREAKDGDYSMVCGLDTFYFKTEIFKG